MSTIDENEEPKASEGVSRRTMLKRAGAAGVATVWAVPVVQSLGMQGAAAQGSPPPGSGFATVTGTVLDAQTGAPIAGALVSIQFTALTAVTDVNGAYSISNVPSGTQTVQASASGYQSASTSVIVPSSGSVTVNFALSAVGQAVRIVLAWGPVPSDLDLHGSGPDGASGRFHVAWYDRTPTDFVSLDRDDTTSFGPETVSITVSPTYGNTYVAVTYRFWVHNFSQTPEFDASGASLTLTGPSGQIAVYPVTGATGDPAEDIWRVVDFDLDTSGTVSNLTVQQVFVAGNSGSTF